jgi:hypothetical protein
MYGADYVWILQKSHYESWWNIKSSEYVDCARKQLHEAVENVIILSSYNHIEGEQKSINGLVRIS